VIEVSPREVYDVVCEDRIVGRIMLSGDAQFRGAGPSLTATTRDRTPTHGYDATWEAAMQAFARSWLRE
jgi:hypothetical protein